MGVHYYFAKEFFLVFKLYFDSNSLLDIHLSMNLIKSRVKFYKSRFTRAALSYFLHSGQGSTFFLYFYYYHYQNISYTGIFILNLLRKNYYSIIKNIPPFLRWTFITSMLCGQQGCMY